MKKCVLFLLLAVISMNVLAGTDPWENVNAILLNIKEPVFPSRDFIISQFGAKADGKTWCTKAINSAIDKCNMKGGGRVIIPKGEWLTGPITLKSNVNLHLEEGAVLKFSNNPADYTQFVPTRWEGMDCINFHPLIYAYEQKNIAITGKGVLDGQASNETWWYMKGAKEDGWKPGMNSQELGGRDSLIGMVNNNVLIEKRLLTPNHCLRPQFINTNRCKNVLIEDVQILGSPFWVIHPLLSENVIVRGVDIKSHGPNNDGCDPESCKNVLIDSCTFDTGDDCIAIKSGRNNDGRNTPVPSKNIVIRNCNMKDGHGGVVIGSEISAGCRNVFVEDCMMDSPNLDRVIRIKSNTVRGGLIENLFVRHITVGQCAEAVFRIELKYEAKEGKGLYLPVIRNMEMRDVNSKSSRYGVFMEGLDESIQISDIRFINCNFENVLAPTRITGAKDILFQNFNTSIKEVKVIK